MRLGRTRPFNVAFCRAAGHDCLFHRRRARSADGRDHPCRNHRQPRPDDADAGGGTDREPDQPACLSGQALRDAGPRLHRAIGKLMQKGWN